jgi:hypothetical protein
VSNKGVSPLSKSVTPVLKVTRKKPIKKELTNTLGIRAGMESLFFQFKRCTITLNMCDIPMPIKKVMAESLYTCCRSLFTIGEVRILPRAKSPQPPN